MEVVASMTTNNKRISVTEELVKTGMNMTFYLSDAASNQGLVTNAK